jgi:L-threonylcarbamoyladenylate synthase
MHFIKIDPVNPVLASIKQAAQVIRSGGVIVYPTDTLYGFGIDLNNQLALEKLTLLKGRQAQKPLSVLINSQSQLEGLTGPLNSNETLCFTKLLPGKITILLPRRITAPIDILNRYDRIGVRYPVSKICTLLINEIGFPISSTSVNLSGQANLKSAEDIRDVFGKRVDLILDAGPVKSTRGSTILDCSFFPPQLVRTGEVSANQIGRILGTQIRPLPNKFIILFICSGNICRSPMAEGILKRVLRKTKYKDRVEVKSAGTLKIENAHAAIESIEIAGQYDVPLAQHRSRALNRELLSEADLVFCMSMNHLNYINSHFPEFKDKVFLLKQWHEKKKLSNPSIADPIGHNLDFFKKTFNQIYIEIMRVLPEIFKLLKTDSEHSEKNEHINM